MEMKKNISVRLKDIMEERNLRQVDIVNMCKPYCEKYNVRLTKSKLNQYVSGYTAPSEKSLTVLAMALNVNEAWLMGYDFPLNPSEDNILISLLIEYKKLNAKGKKEAIKRISELTYIPQYIDNPN